MSTIQVGTVVRLWSDAAPYGVVTKINRKTFVVSHNQCGRTLYKFDSKFGKDYFCTSNVFRCSPVEILTDFIYNDTFQGTWWSAELERQIKELYNYS